MARVRLVPLSTLFAALMFSGASWGAPGTAQLVGLETLKVARCGADRGALTFDLQIAADGTWTATLSGDVYTGTSTTLGTAVTLALSQPSVSLLTSRLTGDASSLCDDNVTVNSLAITGAVLKINKKLTAAKLKFSAVATGSTSAGSGTGKYAIKAAGPWQPAAS